MSPLGRFKGTLPFSQNVFQNKPKIRGVPDLKKRPLSNWVWSYEEKVQFLVLQ